MAILPGIIQAVLDADDNHSRFELFCIDICSVVEGIDIVPTSKTWDLGRDGRSALSGLRGIRTILCATLRADIERKVEEDISRLADTSITNSIIYCSSQSLTEAKCDDIEDKILQLYPGLQSIEVHGQVQLIKFIERHEDIFRKHYSAEITNVEEALLLKPAVSPDIKELGLRLALCTQVGDDASELRKELIRCLVLYALNKQEPQTSGQLASSITSDLHLPRALSSEYIQNIVNPLVVDGLIHLDGYNAHITESGTEYIVSVPKEAGIKLLEGRVAVRDAIKTLSGHTIDDTQYDKLWSIFQEGITELFYSHGISIVRIVRSVIADDSYTLNKETLVFPIENLADRIAEIFSLESLAQEIRQSIIDMFFEKRSKAFNWLTQMCSVYVMICSLGLEELSSQQIMSVLSTYHVVPDSDILISLLCERESNHQDVDIIIKGWSAIGGRLFVAVPVLEEVAFHAWRADNEYCQYGPKLKDISDYDIEHVIDNAFLRTFRRIAKDNTAPKYWNSYISNFRGNSETDYSHVLDILKDEYNVNVLPELLAENYDLSKRLADYIISSVAETSALEVADIDPGTRGKAIRDGKLIASVYQERQVRKQEEGLTTSCIVSSAFLLKEADMVFRRTLGPPEMVLSAAAISFLLTLTPQVSMTISTLRSVLFDTALATKFTSAQSYAYRLIAASGQWDIPYSRRATLQRELQRVLYNEATLRGEPISKIRERVMSNENPEYSAQVVVSALDNLAIASVDKEEFIRTKSQLAKVKEDLESLRRERKSTPRKKRPL